MNTIGRVEVCGDTRVSRVLLTKLDSQRQNWWWLWTCNISSCMQDEKSYAAKAERVTLLERQNSRKEIARAIMIRNEPFGKPYLHRLKNDCG
jgi:hypothetical protein